ncbi:hypothetical protein F5X68DRAFT_67598 [Plectosphaerella plurivora]|uniref:Uncharacterized protein n=1 Tax=Plectosphaerella plurivora TaxID=936078 RepID=A0A9P8VHG4_9PEZI|nr:hypothetical protein F5X68DRAFT_67598 [Plectosphaerella plurivora]
MAQKPDNMAFFKVKAIIALCSALAVSFVGNLVFFGGIPARYYSKPDIGPLFMEGLVVMSINMEIFNIVFCGCLPEPPFRADRETSIPISIFPHGWEATWYGVRGKSIFYAFVVAMNLLAYANGMATDAYCVKTVMKWVTLERLWEPMAYVAGPLVHISIVLSHIGAVVYILFFWPLTAKSIKKDAGSSQAAEGVGHGEVSEKPAYGQGV